MLIAHSTDYVGFGCGPRVGNVAQDYKADRWTVVSLVPLANLARLFWMGKFGSAALYANPQSRRSAGPRKGLALTCRVPKQGKAHKNIVLMPEYRKEEADGINWKRILSSY